MALLEFRDIECPCCGEPITLALDASAGSQRYIEDCPVCCRPISLSLRLDDEGELEDLGVDRE